MGGRLVVIVDDDPSIRLLCRVNLELDGHRPLEAPTIDRARAIVEERRGEVDVVLLDVHVGTGDGFAFLRELRERHPGVGVALLSGTADHASVAAAEPDAILGKPFTLEELRRAVEEVGSREAPGDPA